MQYRRGQSTVWTMTRLLNWLVGWCRGMWAWACVQRMLWRTLGVLVLAIVCAWFWPAGAEENRIRYAGTALQILGIGTVWWGFEKTRKLFGFEYTVVAFWRWLRGCPWWRGQTNTVTVPLTGISGFGMSAGSLSARVATADTSLAARLAILEQNVSLMDSQHSAAISTLEAKLQDVKSAHGRTSEDHRLRIERVDRKLLIAQTGGLDLSLGGLVWLAFGVVATSIPGEIVCWFGLA
jgi:hypothetical protein